ncbi:hypothetical protein LCGC14_1673480, partial [marine sediment metagenome]
SDIFLFGNFIFAIKILLELFLFIEYLDKLCLNQT